MRRQFADQPHEPQVLHNDGVGPRRDDACDKSLGLGQFIGKNERVERDVPPHIVAVEVSHDLGQFF